MPCFHTICHLWSVFEGTSAASPPALPATLTPVTGATSTWPPRLAERSMGLKDAALIFAQACSRACYWEHGSVPPLPEAGRTAPRSCRVPG